MTFRHLFPLICLLLPACQQKMAVQPAPRPDDPSAFFADGRAARPLVKGTVARGHLRTDQALFTGKDMRASADWFLPASLFGASTMSPLDAIAITASEPTTEVDLFPFPVTREVLERGQQRFNIYCIVCHDALGTGHGKIVERGYTQPPSYYIERLRAAPVGHFFDVITNGYGSMPEYRQQIPPHDRWAIAAYIRALQLSQRFPVADLAKDKVMQAEWNKVKAQAGGQR